MTLLEMSALYADSAARIRSRLAQLRAAAQDETDPQRTAALARRIAALEPSLQECRELAMWTARYYDADYRKPEAYAI